MIPVGGLESDQQLLLARIGVRIELARVPAEGGDTLADRALGQPLRLQQDIGAGRKLGHLLQAEGVEIPFPQRVVLHRSEAGPADAA